MKKFSRLSILLGIGISVAGLALMAYIGFYNRYWADDWCYNVDFKNLGIFGTLKTYFFTGADALRGYSTNRYSLTLLSGLLYLPGIFGAQIVATLVIVLWLAGLFWVLSNLSKLRGNTTQGIILLSATFLLYYTLFISPQRFQILYWSAGVHYSFTLITGLYLAGFITSQMLRNKRNKIMDYLAVPLAFFAGGLSETGCAFLVSGTALLLVATWYWKRKQVEWAQRAYPTILIVFVSLLASMAVLTFSPSNSRYESMSAKPISLLLVPFLSFRFSLDFIIDSLKSLPVPHVIFILMFICLSIISRFLSTDKYPADFWKDVFFLFSTAIIVWLLISAIQAPSVLFYNAPPDPRGKSLARFTMLVGLALIAWRSGQIINYLWPKQLLLIIAITGIIISSTYTARTLMRTYAQLPEFITRAELWDKRDADIRQAIANGQTKIEVLVIDMKGVGVGDIMRSKSMNGEWINSCGSKYYGLEAIKARQP